MQCSYRNSRGTEISFSDWPLMLQDPESLFRVIRKYTVGSGKIAKIYATAQEFSFTVSAFAETAQDYAATMSALQACIESDVIDNTPGALYFNGAYLCCYCIARELDDWDADDGSGELKLTVVAADPIWLTDRVISMMDQVSGTAACSRGAVCRTINCDIHYLSAAADCKKLYSKATLLQRGRNITVFATQVTDGSGRLCATGTYTFRLKQEDLDVFLYGETD